MDEVARVPPQDNFTRLQYGLSERKQELGMSRAYSEICFLVDGCSRGKVRSPIGERRLYCLWTCVDDMRSPTQL